MATPKKTINPLSTTTIATSASVVTHLLKEEHDARDLRIACLLKGKEGLWGTDEDLGSAKLHVAAVTLALNQVTNTVHHIPTVVGPGVPCKAFVSDDTRYKQHGKLYKCHKN